MTFPPYSLVVPNDVLVMEPGSPNYLMVTRFTAPSTGVFNITGSFTDLQASSVDLAILANGTPKFNGSFAGISNHQAAIPFSILNVALAQGTTLDFVVDSLGDQANDVVGLAAQISNTSVGVPTPIAGVGPPGLMLAGGWFLIWRHRRKSA